MTISEMSLVVTLSASVAVFFIYCYLFIQYRQFYLGLWSFSWALHFIRFAFISTPLTEIMPNSLILYILCNVLSAYIMLLGTSKFVGVTIGRRWYTSAFMAFIVSSVAVSYNTPHIYFLIPACLYLGLAYCKTGTLFIYKLDGHGLGRFITGISFFVLGIHLMDLPFLITVSWIAPWGFLIDAALRFIIAIGTLIVYLDKTRNDLLAKEQYYRLLAENASDVIYRFKFVPKMHFEYISPSVKKLTGHSPYSFYKSIRLIFSLTTPNDRPILKMFARKFFYEPDHTLSLRIRRSDSSMIWVEQTSVPIVNEEGSCIGFEGIVRDITTRKNLEQDISRLDSLNTVGQMAASVAHEIRNPMTTIRGYLQFFASKREFSTYTNQFGLMIDELDRTNLIIKEYLTLSKHRTIDLKLSNLNVIIESLYPLVKADSNADNKDIHIHLSDIPLIYLDEKEIRQLILNIVRNGLEATSSDGIVIIRTFQQSDEIVLSIQDNGSGIPEHILDNLGKPFVTTKETGTGLGLATCYRIANRHQAVIKVESTPSGTTFNICFKILD